MTDSTRDDGRRAAEAVLKRERKEIRKMGLTTLLLWLAAAALIPAIFLPFAAKVAMTLEQLNRDAADGQVTAVQVVNALGPLFQYGVKVTLVSFGFAIGAAILASGMSYWMVVTMKRATLRQMSENLAEISAQLREMKGGGN